MNRDELQEVINDFHRLGLSNGEALGHHSGINDEIADLLEKHIPQKVILTTEADREFEDYLCPNCKTILEQRFKKLRNKSKAGWKHCQYCGQMLDWEAADNG